MAGQRGPETVVVTGGAIGIGAAIAEAFGRRGAYVVTLDPMVALDGSPQGRADAEPTTAERIVAAGGRARASNTSVTDAPAVAALFAELVAEFGALDAVVNVAGISRPTGFAFGTEEDWARVLDVHLVGYLTVLGAALPIMAGQGHGRILGVTSGSGWRPADAGAYSCAKRAVAAVTWQVGRVAPAGVSVNALSPIAATRMIANALSRQPAGGDGSGKSAASGGVALAAAPPPEHLGPIGAYLAGPAFAWSTGQVVFSNGAEVSAVRPPHLIEAVRTTAVPSLPRVVDTAMTVLASAETAQVSNGASVPRLTAAFTADAAGPATEVVARRCLVVTDDPAWRTALEAAATARGLAVVHGDADATGLAAVTAVVDAAGTGTAPVDAVVVALVGAGATGAGTGGADWASVLAGHEGIAGAIQRDATWVRAVADVSARTEAPMRVVTVTAATAPGGRSRAMAAAQLTRSAHSATQQRVDAFAVAVESGDPGARGTTAELVARLVAGTDGAALSGAELVVDTDWLGLRSHPTVGGTVSYGGPELPDWLDGAVRRIIGGEPAA